MSDEIDEHSPKAGLHSPSATQFDPSEASSAQQEKFEPLWFYQENIKRDRNNTNSQEVRRRKKGHILDSISSKLELPEYQHEEAQSMLENIDFSEQNDGQFLSLEAYCFTICVMVHNSYADSRHKYLPYRDAPKKMGYWESLQEKVGVSDKQLSQALGELKDDE
jgi:hypothetical protein